MVKEDEEDAKQKQATKAPIQQAGTEYNQRRIKPKKKEIQTS
jgi:hypothetical protein